MPDEVQAGTTVVDPTPVSTAESVVEAATSPSTLEPAEVLPEAMEAPGEADNIEVGKDDFGAETPTVEAVVEELPAEGAAAERSEAATEPVPPEQTAQAPVLEPLPSKLSLLATARSIFQFRKRKRLEKIMTVLTTKSQITNDQVEKLLHVSDATATRYLSQLEREGRIKQTGKVGKAVSYTNI